MANLSIIEFIVYGIIGYSGILILIISIITNPPKSMSLAGARSIWLMPSILCLSVLMFASGVITTDNQTTTSTIINNSTNEVWIETGTVANEYQLVDPVWGWIHFAFFIILIIYIIIQTLTILVQKKE